MTERKASLACGHDECVTGLPCKRQAPEYWSQCTERCLWCQGPGDVYHALSATERVWGCLTCAPRPVHGGGTDDRYTVTEEGNGTRPYPVYVLRFCGEYEGWGNVESVVWQMAVVKTRIRNVTPQPGFTEDKRND